MALRPPGYELDVLRERLRAAGASGDIRPLQKLLPLRKRAARHPAVGVAFGACHRKVSLKVPSFADRLGIAPAIVVGRLSGVGDATLASGPG